MRVTALSEGATVMISVADDGPGIPEYALTRVFDPFFRIDDSRDRNTGGTGLGLAITKTCVEACGGTVTCCNVQPHGLEIFVKLKAG